MPPVAPMVALCPEALVNDPPSWSTSPPPWKSIPPLAVVVALASVPAEKVNRPVLASVPVVVAILPPDRFSDENVRLLAPKLTVPPETCTAPLPMLVMALLKLTLPPEKVLAPVTLYVPFTLVVPPEKFTVPAPLTPDAARRV